MEKDSAVQNQKVFTTLRGITLLARRYDVICNYIEEYAADNSAQPHWRGQKDAFEFVIDVLSLPIDKRTIRKI